MLEVRHELLQKCHTNQPGCMGTVQRDRPKRFLYWSDIEEILDFYIKEEDK